MGSENKLMHARQEEVFFFPTATALGVFRLHTAGLYTTTSDA